MLMYLQNITHNADTPQVCCGGYRVKVHHFRRHKLGCAKQHAQVLPGGVLPGQAEVNDLDAISLPRETKNIFRLQADERHNIGGGLTSWSVPSRDHGGHGARLRPRIVSDSVSTLQIPM